MSLPARPQNKFASTRYDVIAKSPGSIANLKYIPCKLGVSIGE